MKPYKIIVRPAADVGEGITADVVTEDGKAIDSHEGLTVEGLHALSAELGVPYEHEDPPA